ncbi:MAG: ABC transporter substrate-binding protein [Deltaproteobacteria bacterium]|nr:ABC transporter substrate-binding protein [Deltaproteobacteria bacterium]
MRIKVIGFALGALLVALCCSAEAQQSAKTSRLGILPFDQQRSNENMTALFQELRRLGYVEGQNITIEFRNAEGNVDRLPGLAADLVRLKVDVIVAAATPAALAAKKATSTIPIVFTVVADPIGSGLVASLAQPGGNVTGTTNLNRDLTGKRLELLKEAFPKITTVAVLSNPADQVSAPQLKDLEIVARALKLKLQILEARDPNDFDAVAAALKKKRLGALIPVTSQMFASQGGKLADIATKNRLPAIYWARGITEAGGLMSYGTNVPELFRRTAQLVDKILKGTKPADIPVEQPMRFEFVVNLKTAKQIGVTIEPNVLVRADKVIR